jgi:hypothetical protein
MKQNKKVRNHTNGNLKAKVIVFSILLAAAVCGFYYTYSKLIEIYLERCVVVSIEKQIKIKTTAKVRESVILELFGITKGCNLAKINFEKKRAKILSRYPNFRAVTIRRIIPDKLEIDIEERTPTVRLEEIPDRHRTKQVSSGRVADSEGVVFKRSVGTEALPVIYEKPEQVTRVGGKLSGRSRAALQLLDVCKEAPYSDLGITTVHLSKKDYIIAVLGNFSIAKIAWQDMDEENASSKKYMLHQLHLLRNSVMSGIIDISEAGANHIIWNATQTDRIFADTKEPIR